MNAMNAMNANLVPFANKLLDVEFKTKAFQEMGDQTRASELLEAVKACKIAYQAALPPAPAPAGDVMAILQALRDDFHTAFDEVRNSFAGIEVRLTGMEGRLTVIEGRITTVDDRIADVQGRLGGIEGRMTMIDGKITGIQSQLVTVEATLKQDRAINYNRHYRPMGTAEVPWTPVPFTDGKLPADKNLPPLDTQEAVYALTVENLRSYEDEYGLSHLGGVPARRKRLIRFIGGEIRPV